MTPLADSPRTVLVTGAARRVGAAIVRMQHAAGWNVIIHAHRSFADAQALAAELEALRPDSARALHANLAEASALAPLARAAQACFGRLDALVNNASTYYKTPLGTIDAAQIDDLVASNLRAPLLLTQACAPLLADGGSIVNLLDTQVRRPQPPFAAYYAAKAGLWVQTEALALELAPRLRINGVAPGHTLWTDDGSGIEYHEQAAELARIPLGRLAGAIEIARAVRFLLSDDAGYITGAILPVDGGLRLR